MPYRRPVSPDSNLRWCSKCADFQPRDNFCKRASTPDGLDYYCRPHRAASNNRYAPVGYAYYGRDHHLKSTYGLSGADYDALLAAQAGVCAICRQPETSQVKGKVKALAVDHCHQSGKVRGLLCKNCNTALGSLRDSIPLLENALAYLKS